MHSRQSAACSFGDFLYSSSAQTSQGSSRSYKIIFKVNSIVTPPSQTVHAILSKLVKCIHDDATLISNSLISDLTINHTDTFNMLVCSFTTIQFDEMTIRQGLNGLLYAAVYKLFSIETDLKYPILSIYWQYISNSGTVIPDTNFRMTFDPKKIHMSTIMTSTLQCLNLKNVDDLSDIIKLEIQYSTCNDSVTYAQKMKGADMLDKAMLALKNMLLRYTHVSFDSCNCLMFKPAKIDYNLIIQTLDREYRHSLVGDHTSVFLHYGTFTICIWSKVGHHRFAIPLQVTNTIHQHQYVNDLSYDFLTHITSILSRTIDDPIPIVNAIKTNFYYVYDFLLLLNKVELPACPIKTVLSEHAEVIDAAAKFDVVTAILTSTYDHELISDNEYKIKYYDDRLILRHANNTLTIKILFSKITGITQNKNTLHISSEDVQYYIKFCSIEAYHEHYDKLIKLFTIMQDTIKKRIDVTTAEDDSARAYKKYEIYRDKSGSYNITDGLNTILLRPDTKVSYDQSTITVYDPINQRNKHSHEPKINKLYFKSKNECNNMLQSLHEVLDYARSEQNFHYYYTNTCNKVYNNYQHYRKKFHKY